MREIIPINFKWLFKRFEEIDLKHINKDVCETVDIPHTAVELPYHHFDEKTLEGVFSYVYNFQAKESWKDRIIHIQFEAVAHAATVYLNHQKVFEHVGGYTPFEVDLTDTITFNQENELLVIVDSTENPLIPPFGGVADFLGYAGIYREVSLIIFEQKHINNVFVYTDGKSHVSMDVTLSHPTGLILYKIKDHKTVIAQGMVIADQHVMHTETLIDHPQVWDIDHPFLYQLEINYEVNHLLVDHQSVSFGIRHVEFKSDGFYLNDKKVKLLGLNRHQSYPYVGYAMPKRAQEEDADMLKYQLGVNIVRTSHYPQSPHFLKRADEIGLLVFEEIPGWQFIGNDIWQERTLQHVREMIIRDRNHPSIILWGVRINESPDHHDLYTKTNELARSLDPTRPTGGVRNLQHSEFLEDVYTYNDFSHTGENQGLDLKHKVTKNVPYLVTENNGHMYPTKAFDDETHRVNHAKRHLRVINDMMHPDNGISGSIGWVMNDYNTHHQFGSGDKICYHGVMDMYRIRKYASDSYFSQQSDIHVMNVCSSMDIGEHPGGLLPHVLVLTNVDYIKLYKNKQYIKTFYPDQKTYPHLKHAPIVIDDFIGDTLMENEHMTKKDAERTKRVFQAITISGNRLPLKHKLSMLYLLKKYHLSFDDGLRMFYQYNSSWGSAGTTYTFEGYKDDQCVITRHKGNATSFHYNIHSPKEALKHHETYDVYRIIVEKKDQFDNTVPYASDVFSIEAKGSIDIIGPKQRSLIHGATAFWIKSIKTGKGTLTLMFNDQKITKEVHVDGVDIKG